MCVESCGRLYDVYDYIVCVPCVFVAGMLIIAEYMCARDRSWCVLSGKEAL